MGSLVIIKDTALICEYPIYRRFQILRENGVVESREEDRLRAISFKNVGDDVATIENFTLSPGDGMLTLSGENDTCDLTSYHVIFAGVGTAPKIEIIKVFGKNPIVRSVKLQSVVEL
jgi:hypothetical protein